MSEENVFYKQGREKVSLAIAAENCKDYELAFKNYHGAVEIFVTGLKYEKNEAVKKEVSARTSEYLARCEEIKKALNNNNNNSNNGSGGTATKSKEDSKNKEDDENSKLKKGLSNVILAEKPNVKWDDVAGLEGAKEALKEAVILPIKFPQLFTGKRVPWKGILLYGPPGTGKSFLAKAVATEASSTFFSVTAADLVSKWQGESERLVKSMFEMARDAKPAIIFIDEIDSLCTNRSEGESEGARRIKTEFLIQMDGVGKDAGGLLVLGATNVPWEIDPAMRRRFEKRVYIPLPELHARNRMIKLNLGDTPHTINDQQLELLASKTEGFSGSDIAILVRDAIMAPLRKCQSAKQFSMDNQGFFYPLEEYPNCPRCPISLSYLPSVVGVQCSYCQAIRNTLYDIPSGKLKEPKVTFEDFNKSLERAHASVAISELDRFISWTETFGQEG